MNLWVKICGNTRLEDALAAVEAGADALGFVFAPSPRQVATQVVEQMMPELAGRAECIGVFVNAEADAVAQTVERCGLTGVQLHSGAAPDSERLATAQLLRTRFGGKLRILGAVSYDIAAAAEVEQMAADGIWDAVLVDTKVSGKAGGSGVTFDWTEAARTVFACNFAGNGPARVGLPLVAAGGLRPENVAEAVRVLRPWGVDVASGVELRPGVKDPERVQEFVRRAKQAGLTTQN